MKKSIISSPKTKNLLFIVLIILPNLFFVYPSESKIETQKIKDENITIYKPRPGRKRSQARKSGAYRGGNCKGKKKLQNALTLIIPENHIPLTVSERPTFFWHTEVDGIDSRFTIYEPGKPSPIYVQDIPQTKKGISVITIPKSAQSLRMGVKYRWTVSIICNSSRPSENILAKAWIERVKEKPGSFNDKQNCLSYFAKLGIWHDALACQTQFSNEFWSLINQIQLKEVSQNKPVITLY